MTGAAGERPAPARWRRVVAVVLVVVAALLAPLTVTALWVRDRILRTDGYVETVAPLASDPTVTDALASRIVDELFAATDLEDRVTDALPGPVDVLGPALTGSLHDLALSQTERFLESDAFESLWISANRAAHEQVVAMFTGRGDAVTTQDDAIVLDLGAVADKVRERLVDRGVGVLKRVEVPKGAIEVTIFESGLVPDLRTAFDVLDTLATVLPVLFVAALVAGIAIAPRRRPVLVASGLSVAATTALLLVGIDLGRRVTVDQASQASLDTDATKVVYDTLVVALRDWSWYVIGVGILVALVALVSNPGWIGRVAERLRGSSPEVPPVATWVRIHRVPLTAGIAGLALGVLVVWPTPTLLVVAMVVLATAVALAAVLALARMQPRPPPPDPSADPSPDPLPEPSVAPEPAAASERVDEVG